MKIHGKNAVLFVKEHKVAGDANRLNFTYNIDTAEVTGFEAPAKEYVEGQYGWTVGMNGYWNSAENQSDPVLRTMVGMGTHIVGIFPQGTASGNIGYEGRGILTNYSPEITIGGPVVFSADVQGDSELSRTKILYAGVGGTINGAAYNLGTLAVGKSIIGFVRSVSDIASRGTLGVGVWAGTTETGTFGALYSFTDISTLTGYVEYKTNATSIVNVGPWYYAKLVPTTGDAFSNITVSCRVES